jgi:AcrR family transcriptional regulator
VTARAPLPRDEGRTEVIRRAATAIARHGYHGMSMRDLAKATKRSLASFYHLFESKEEILFELQRSAFEALIESAETAIAAPRTPAARFEAFVDNHVRFFCAQPDVMHVLVVEASALPPGQRAVIRRLKQRYFKLGERVLAHLAAKRGAAPDPIALERATYCVFGMLNWIFGWYEPERHGPPAALVRTIVDCAEHGAAAAILNTSKGRRS